MVKKISCSFETFILKILFPPLVSKIYTFSPCAVIMQYPLYMSMLFIDLTALLG